MAKRTKCIEPLRALELITDAVSAARERLWGEAPASWDYDERAAFVDRNINLLEIREVVAVEMARNGLVFDSGYRHEVDELHCVVYRILGNTVAINHQIATLNSESAPAF